MDRKTEDSELILDALKQHTDQISALIPKIPSMHLKSDDIELILDVLKQHADQISTSKTLLEKSNVRLSYFFSYNPGIKVFMKTPNLEGDINVYFGSGTANIDVYDFSSGEGRYTWHGVIEDIPQFLGVLREAFAVLFTILEDDEGHK